MSTIPSAITTSFLQNLLKEYIDDVASSKLSIVPIAAGDNFTSNLHKLNVTYEDSSKQTTFILKFLAEDEVLSDHAKVMKLFDTEIDMYSRILPNIYNLEYVNKFWATCFYASLTPPTILILEDLTKLGYKMQCRHKGLDLNHCMLVIETLAYLHATSVAISKKVTLSNLNLGIFSNNRYTTSWATLGLESVIETCKKFNHLNRYATKLQTMQDNFLEKVFASTKNTNICNVLNHGDCWVNNLLFSYNKDGTVKEVKFLDFQQCIYSSPVLDLHYFWATSTNIDVLTKHFDDILDYYCDQFLRNLKKLKVVEILPNKLEIISEFKQKVIYGLMTLVSSTALIKSSKTPDATIENFLTFSEEGSFRYDCYNNKRYVETITHLLPFYDSLGVFD